MGNTLFFMVMRPSEEKKTAIRRWDLFEKVGYEHLCQQA